MPGKVPGIFFLQKTNFSIWPDDKIIDVKLR